VACQKADSTKQGLSVEAISIPGSSLALNHARRELPSFQLGGGVDPGQSCRGGHSHHPRPYLKNFFLDLRQTDITRMEDLKEEIFGTTRFGTLSDLASRFALRSHGIDPERDITMVQTAGR
jgi:hypothetical protein